MRALGPFERYQCLDHRLKGSPGCTFVRCTNMRR